MSSGDGVVIDVGTSTTKIGYTGRDFVDPSMVIPTIYRPRDLSDKVSAYKTGAEDLDFFIGYEGADRKTNYIDKRFINRGAVEDWNALEHFYEQIFFKYLRVDPEDTPVVLTEHPLNKPENREYTAEIMFETFNVPKLFLFMQGVCSVYAYSYEHAKSKKKFAILSGSSVVVESGDGATSILPVSQGFVITEAVSQMDLGGSDVTRFIADFLKERKTKVPPEDRLDCATFIKEKHCKTLSGPNEISSTFKKSDANPKEYFKTVEFTSKKSNKKYDIKLGYEQFLAPEIFFTPEIVSSKYKTPLARLIHECVLKSPINCRKGMYSNIILSGGNTSYKKIRDRMKCELQGIVDEYRKLSSIPEEIEVNVYHAPKYSVYIGASLMAGLADDSSCYTKKEYDEVGSSIARKSPVFHNA